MRTAAALLLSLAAHWVVYRGISLPETRPETREAPFLWVSPERASAPRSSTSVATSRGPGGTEGSAPAPAATQWRALSEVVAFGNRPPEYPALALEREWEGTVRLKVDFDEGGRFESVTLESSSGHGILDEAALAAAKGWHVEGGRRSLIVPVAFRLGETDAG